MVKAVRTQSGLEGAVLGRMLVLVRGQQVLSVPTTQLPELVEMIQQLSAAGGGPSVNLPAVAQRQVALAPVPEVGPSIQALPAELPAFDDAALAVSTAAPRPPLNGSADKDRRLVAGPRAESSRRGRIWEAVKQSLQEQVGALSYEDLLEIVSSRALTARNPRHALKICLGKKISSGELIKLTDGRYELADIKPSPTKGRAARKSGGRNRPGKLWQGIREYLERHPEGLTRTELADAAREHEWTTATQVEHAVTICLSRVSDQLVLLAGDRYALRPQAAPEPRRPSVVRRRKKVRDTPEEAIQTAAEPAPAESRPVTDELPPGADFVASSFYPRKKRRR